MALNVLPITLSGKRVELVPLSERHLPELFALGQEQDIWAYLSGSPFKQPEDAKLWLNKALDAQSAGSAVPFTVIDKGTKKVAGTTRYVEIRREHRCLEIGSTWYGQSFRRTHVNTEAKFLLMNHAFGGLNALRVQFQTDSRNVTSQRAIERLGAVREGLLRKHKVCSDGHVRDTVVYSVIAEDWTHVRQRLESLLGGDHSLSRPRLSPAPASRQLNL
jgi:RimJ/RimL family protein N-acetyltransferase